MIANDLLILAIRFDDSEMAETASYYYGFADKSLGWWKK